MGLTGGVWGAEPQKNFKGLQTLLKLSLRKILKHQFFSQDPRSDPRLFQVWKWPCGYVWLSVGWNGTGRVDCLQLLRLGWIRTWCSEFYWRKEWLLITIRGQECILSVHWEINPRGVN